jgi:hypothetical protein
MSAAPFTKWAAGDNPSYWASRGGTGIFSSVETVTDIVVMRAQVIFDWYSAAPYSTRDQDVVDLYWFPIDGAGAYVDPTFWTSDDYNAADDAIGAWWSAVGAHCSPRITLKQVRYYLHGVGAPPPQVVQYVTNPGVIGGGTGSTLPYQSSETTTFRTASQRHWGRIYVPGLTSAWMDTAGAQAGRFFHSIVDDVATGASTHLSSFGSDNTAIDLWVQCVWSPASSYALGIYQYEADDVPDVQRSRRAATTGYRSLVP